jgi:hypothetical protein
VPVHAPFQPVKPEPAVGVAVRVTLVPGIRESEQAIPQLMPAGELVTVPNPEPPFLTESVRGFALAALPVPDPRSPREIVSPPAAKFTLLATVLLVVGRKRTVRVWLLPAASVNELPDRMLYGAATLAVPDRLVGLVLCSVKVRSAVLPTVTLPKLMVVEGLTVKSGWARPLADVVHALSFPEVSTAVTRAKYVVPAVSAVIRLESICPVVGVVVGDVTRKNDVPGHVGLEVPR